MTQGASEVSADPGIGLVRAAIKEHMLHGDTWLFTINCNVRAEVRILGPVEQETRRFVAEVWSRARKDTQVLWLIGSVNLEGATIENDAWVRFIDCHCTPIPWAKYEELRAKSGLPAERDESATYVVTFK